MARRVFRLLLPIGRTDHAISKIRRRTRKAPLRLIIRVVKQELNNKLLVLLCRPIPGVEWSDPPHCLEKPPLFAGVATPNINPEYEQDIFRRLVYVHTYIKDECCSSGPGGIRCHHAMSRLHENY